MNHTWFPDTSSLQTSTVCLHVSPSVDLLQGSVSLYHVKYSRLLNSEDLPALTLAPHMRMSVGMLLLNMFVRFYFDSTALDKKRMCEGCSGLISLA